MDELTRAEARSGAAEASVLLEDYEAALVHYDAYIAGLQKMTGEGPEILAIALINRATVLLHLSRAEEALVSLQAATFDIKWVEVAEGRKGFASGV